MQQIENLTLHWKQPDGFKSRFELYKDDELIARLDWTKTWHSVVKAESPIGNFTFRCGGWWRIKTTLHREDTRELVAHFDTHYFSDSLLVMQDGRKFRWKNTSAIKMEFEWIDEANNILMHFKPANLLMKYESEVRMESAALTNPHIHLLLTFGWYLVISAYQSAMAVIT